MSLKMGISCIFVLTCNGNHIKGIKLVLQSIIKQVEPELAVFDQAILEKLQANIPLISDMSHHIIKSGGKRLRPLLVLLGSKVFSYGGSDDIQLAIAMEYFHTATLLHDDVVDNSALRRGQETAHAVWGSKASVLVGDFLFTRAFQLLAEVGNIQILTILSDASNTITRGEILQLLNCHDVTISQQEYMEVIRSKTATLFSVAAQMGALLTKQDPSLVAAMAEYGLHLGSAFQLVDDALDYCASLEQLGKNIGDDLAEGKATLPLIYAYHHGNEQQQQAIGAAMKDYKQADLAVIQQALQVTKAIEYTYQVAHQEVDKALTALQSIEHSTYRDALEQLARFAVERQH